MIRRPIVAVALAGVAMLAPAPAGAAPKRVVALTPFTANVLAELGVRPVAVGQTIGGRDRIAPELAGVPVLPLSHPNGPNLEQLARLRPGMVLSAPTWNRGHKAMRRLGMRVVPSDPRSVAASTTETLRIGRLVGRLARAQKVVARIERETRAATQGIRRRPTVLVVLGVGRSTNAFLPSTWGGDVVKRAGGRLLTQGLTASGGFARISDETVLARNPDIIIAVPHGKPGDIPKVAGYLRTKPGWRRTKAVRNGRLYVSTDDSLLQAWSDAGRTIRQVRRLYLKN